MISFIKKIFSKNKIKEEDSISDVNLACAILLIEVSYSDFSIDNTEISSIIEIFKKEFNLTEKKAQWLSDEALNLHKDVNCLRKYIKLINSNYTNTEKKNLVNMAWLVARADNIIDKHEEHRIRRFAELLHLNHADFIQSKIETKD